MELYTFAPPCGVFVVIFVFIALCYAGNRSSTRHRRVNNATQTLSIGNERYFKVFQSDRKLMLKLALFLCQVVWLIYESEDNDSGDNWETPINR